MKLVPAAAALPAAARDGNSAINANGDVTSNHGNFNLRCQ